MNQDVDSFSRNFTIISTIVICVIVGFAAFDQFATKKVISAEETETNIKPVGQVKMKVVSALAQISEEPKATETAQEVETPVVAEEPKATETAPAEPAQEVETPVVAEESKATETAPAEPTDKVSDVDLANGEETYKSSCFICHDSGAAGAPKLADKEDWAPRITQGEAVMLKHAIEGFTGNKGVMPPKGGRMDLPDENVKNAMNYMILKSQ